MDGSNNSRDNKPEVMVDCDGPQDGATMGSSSGGKKGKGAAIKKKRQARKTTTRTEEKPASSLQFIQDEVQVQLCPVK